jgi:hypothetical protein
MTGEIFNLPVGPSAMLRRSKVLLGAASGLLRGDVCGRSGVDDVGAIFRALVSNRAVYVPGIAADEMVERLQRAWDVEPGYSKTAIVNAVTRAGALLYARVWNVQMPEGAHL